MDHRGIIIRTAGEKDAQEILQCLAAAFEPYRKAYSPGAFADTTLDSEALRKRLRSMHVLVAAEEDSVIGTVSASVQWNEGHLRGMAVLPKVAGTGVAQFLLSRIEQWLLDQGCDRVTLDTTDPLERAMVFYTKHGYRPSGKVSDFFGMRLVEWEKSLQQPKP